MRRSLGDSLPCRLVKSRSTCAAIMTRLPHSQKAVGVSEKAICIAGYVLGVRETLRKVAGVTGRLLLDRLQERTSQVLGIINVIAQMDLLSDRLFVGVKEDGLTWLKSAGPDGSGRPCWLSAKGLCPHTQTVFDAGLPKHPETLAGLSGHAPRATIRAWSLPIRLPSQGRSY